MLRKLDGVRMRITIYIGKLDINKLEGFKKRIEKMINEGLIEPTDISLDEIQRQCKNVIDEEHVGNPPYGVTLNFLKLRYGATLHLSWSVYPALAFEMNFEESKYDPIWDFRKMFKNALINWKELNLDDYIIPEGRFFVITASAKKREINALEKKTRKDFDFGTIYKDRGGGKYVLLNFVMQGSKNQIGDYVSVEPEDFSAFILECGPSHSIWSKIKSSLFAYQLIDLQVLESEADKLYNSIRDECSLITKFKLIENEPSKIIKEIESKVVPRLLALRLKLMKIKFWNKKISKNFDDFSLISGTKDPVALLMSITRDNIQGSEDILQLTEKRIEIKKDNLKTLLDLRIIKLNEKSQKMMLVFTVALIFLSLIMVVDIILTYVGTG